MKVGSIEVKLTEKAYDYIKQLTETGLYGTTDGETATRLLEQALRQELRNGIVSPVQSEPSGPICPNCGSPKVVINGTMGANWHCQDCNQAFN